MKLVSWLFDLQDQVAGRQSVGLKIWHINQKIWCVNTNCFLEQPVKAEQTRFRQKKKDCSVRPQKVFLESSARSTAPRKHQKEGAEQYKTLQGFAQKKSALKNYYCGITRIYLPTNVQKNYLKSSKMNLVPFIYIFILISFQIHSMPCVSCTAFSKMYQ